MKISILVLFLFNVLYSSCVLAQDEKELVFSPDLLAAYEAVLDLRIEEASLQLGQIKIKEPNNYMVYFIENYVDFFSVFIEEEEKMFAQLSKQKDKRLELLKQSNSSSPYYLYTQAEIKLQWALLHLKFNEYLAALSNIRSAYKLLNENLEKYPDFIASKKSLGILHAMMGTVPDKYQWAVKLLSGMRGDIKKGVRQVEEVVYHYRQHEETVLETEALILYAFLMLHVNNSSNEKAWNILNGGQLDPKKSKLATFVLANMAMRIGKNDHAIRLLENAPKSSVYYPMPHLAFMLGLAKTRKLDPQAPRHLKRFIAQAGKANYVKEAYQKLAWYELVHQNTSAYKEYMNLLKNKGRQSVSSDKSAQTEAEEGLLPHPILLKARLLFDGGYYDRARRMLLQHPQKSFSDSNIQLEYIYRLGRIEHESGNTLAAINYYQQTVAQGSQNPLFYACNAALKMGLLYESLQEYASARQAFHTCLDLSPNQYKNSLHGKAKAGLNRVEGK